MMKVSLVIPLFNNAQTLIPQLTLCEKVMKKTCSEYEIIIGEDKSTDNSARLLKKHYYQKPSYRVLFNKQNLGIARNIKRLYAKARYPLIVLFSVDGDWDPKDIEKLLHTMQKSNANIVVGKRTYQYYSPYRKAISFFYNFLPYLFFQVKTMDAGSIKVFRSELFQKEKLTSQSIFFEAEFIIRAARKGSRIIGIPVTFNKQGNNKALGGELHLVVASFLDLLRLRFTS